MRNILFAGTAGAGKSTLTASFQNWMSDNGHETVTVNLDPGADVLPYEPDLDIREWVKLEDVMKEYRLGPNGAQVAAADLLALNMDKICEPLLSMDADYALLDTPGQLELFAYRQSGNVIIDRLGNEETMLVFLTEPSLCRTPSGYISSTLLFASVSFRFETAALNVMSKADLISEQEVQRILEWSAQPEMLYDDLLNSSTQTLKNFSLETFRILQELEAYPHMIPVSSEDYEGMEELYSKAQDIFYGGEDLDRR